jgi:hypothetical protein
MCPKCGSSETKTAYREPQSTKRAWYYPILTEESLEISCMNCGYLLKRTTTLDSKYPGALVEDDKRVVFKED